MIFTYADRIPFRRAVRDETYLSSPISVSAIPLGLNRHLSGIYTGASILLAAENRLRTGFFFQNNAYTETAFILFGGGEAGTGVDEHSIQVPAGGTIFLELTDPIDITARISVYCEAVSTFFLSTDEVSYY